MYSVKLAQVMASDTHGRPVGHTQSFCSVIFRDLIGTGTIFFPRVILYSYSSFCSFMVVWGFLGLGLELGLGVRDFQMMGFEACGVGPSGYFWGWGSLYKYSGITMGANFSCSQIVEVRHNESRIN